MQIAERIFYFVLPDADLSYTQIGHSNDALHGLLHSDDGDDSTSTSSNQGDEENDGSDQSEDDGVSLSERTITPKVVARKAKSFAARKRLHVRAQTDESNDSAPEPLSKAKSKAKPVPKVATKARAPANKAKVTKPKASAVEVENVPIVTKAVPKSRAKKVKAKAATPAETKPVVPVPAKTIEPVLEHKIMPAPLPAIAIVAPAPMVLPSNVHAGQPDKPPYSFSALLGQAITHAPEGQATRAFIMQWITFAYPYYRDTKEEWQVSLHPDSQ